MASGTSAESSRITTVHLKIRGRRARLLAVFLLALIGALPPCAAEPAETGAVPPQRPADGQPALLYTIPDLGGRSVDMAGLLQGKVALVAFWASWCQPCLEEIPRLRDLSRSWRHRGVTVVGVGLEEGGDTPAKQRQMAARQLVNYQLLFDQGASFQKAYGLHSLPFNMLIGSDGKIRWQGPILPDDLESRLQALVAEPAPPVREGTGGGQEAGGGE